MFSPERLQFVKFSPVLYVENLVSILSIKEKVSSDFKIFTTFHPITWWILIFLLFIFSLFNVKRKTNFFIDFITSIINHIECLLTKQSMFYSLYKVNFTIFSLKSELNSFKSNLSYFVFILDFWLLFYCNNVQ